MRASFLVSERTRFPRSQPSVSGPARCGRRTKDLARRLQRGDIAVIDHIDMDSVAAQMLVDRGVAGVVNLSPSISGRYPNRGPGTILDASIPLIDVLQPALMDVIKDGSPLRIQGDQLLLNGKELAEGTLITRKLLNQRIEQSRANLDQELRIFAQNTLEHASRELSQLLAPVHPPAVQCSIQGRHALVVVRGETYKQDLRIIRGYLSGVRPALIAVDGGADALLEMGLKPDIIVGDMDSVSEKALRCGAEIVVHTYADGRTAPGQSRIDAMGLKYQTFPVPGTSEDAAMLLAYEHGAELIVAVGTHSSLYDFLDKGRGGMASTLLVRMRIGSRLVDARGVSKLYSAARPVLPILLLLIVGFWAIAMVALIESELLRNWGTWVWDTLRLKVLEWRILSAS